MKSMEDDQNHNNWNVPDNHSSKQLDEISPLSQRLQSRYARIENKNALRLSPANLLSLLDMFRALEYHYDNFTNFVRGMTPQDQSDEDGYLIQKAKFEAAAYINTVGQIGDWTHAAGESCSKIDNIWKTFRSKYTAHRSIDQQRSVDTDRARELHLGVFQGQYWNGDGDLIFQIQLTEGDSHEINIRTDHATIQNEIDNVFNNVTSI